MVLICSASMMCSAKDFGLTPYFRTVLMDRMARFSSSYTLARFALTPPAHLLRDVSEISKGFLYRAPPDHPELQPYVLLKAGFSRSTRKALGIFRPIT
jgi:hypothetical protein